MSEPFETLRAIAAPLLRENVNTDAIIPSREMKHVSKKGLGEGLFADWRYVRGRETNPDFVLNKPEYKGAQILLSLENFGCGSSREHAVWALAEFGFRVIIAPSFGDIFYKNCIQNGVLPICLVEEDIHALAKNSAEITVDLQKQTVENFSFELEAQYKMMLLGGLDGIDLTLQKMADIQQFETKDKVQRPWVYL